MHVSIGRAGSTAFLLVAMLALNGCAFFAKPSHKAPVEDRGSSTVSIRGAAPAPAVVPVETAVAKPGDLETGRPGYYTVKPGDTLIRIGLDTGQNWRDIARWNSIENPNIIEVGQVLRVSATATAGSAAGAEAGIVTRPVAAASAAVATPLGAVGAASAPKPAPATVALAPERDQRLPLAVAVCGSLDVKQ